MIFLSTKILLPLFLIATVVVLWLIFKDTRQNTLGFIILRHVRCEKTNMYWIESYKSIRTHYKDNYIIIIDDNSNYDFITNINLTNTLVINSEYKGSGEVLPYIYFLENKLFDTAVIIHDSVFVKEQIDFGTKAKFLWSFEHTWDRPENEIEIIKTLKTDEPIENFLAFYNNKSLWKGCFGAMTVMPYTTLEHLSNKYDFKSLTKKINHRDARMCFERILAAILIRENHVSMDNLSLLGNIHEYAEPGYSWGYSWKQYKYDDPIRKPIIKVWTAR